jgi:hypothetical protein
MPNLARLYAEGAAGTVLADPPLQPGTAWATIATGRHPPVHGVLAPYAVRQDGGGVEATGRTAWRAPAFWQVLEAAGRKTITAGWPATAPATAWPGTHVDARFAVPTGPDVANWAVPRLAVSPPALVQTLQTVRVHPADVDGSVLARFVPALESIDQYRDAGLTRLAVHLTTASTLHAAATALIGQQDWDVAAVHYTWLDAIQSMLPATGGGPVWDGVADMAYEFADALLGRLMHLAGDDTTIMAVSPNGIRPSADGAAVWRPKGFIAARGRWIAPGTRLPDLRLVDIAPTLLARFGLVADTDGKKITALAPGMSRRPAWVPPPPVPQADRHVKALREAGFADTLTGEQAAEIRQAEARRLLALGESLLAQGRLADAEAALIAGRAHVPPESHDGLQHLARCRVLRGDAAGTREIGESLLLTLPESGWGEVVLAAACALEDDAAGARPFMAVARDKGGRNPDLLAQLGGVALLLQDAGAARLCFKAVQALDPESDAARQGLALAADLAAL